MAAILITNAVLMTFDEAGRVLPDHGLALRDGRIEVLAPVADLDPAGFDEVIDAGGRVVTPGLINAHMHFYSTFATGLTKAAPADDFVGVLENLWWRLDRQLTLDDVHTSALVACIDSVKAGTTTIIDHHAGPGSVTGSLSAVADAVAEVGVRGSLCYEVSDRDGRAVAEAGIAENVSFLEGLAAGRFPGMHGLMGLHACFTLGNETLAAAVAEARRLGTGVHIHVAEDRADLDHSLRQHGKSPVRRLADVGALGPDSICAHCVWTDEADHRLLADSGTIVTHQAQSNMNNAVGVMDLPALQRAGVLVGLGTDAMTNNMLEELRSALWSRKSTDRTPSGGFMEVVDCLVRANPAIASRLWRRPIGMLMPGAAADAVLWDYLPHTPLDSGNGAGHLVFGLSQSRANTTIAAGRILMRDGVLPHLDEVAIRKRAQILAAALWERF